MHLVGASLAKTGSPIDTAWLPLGPLTIVFGANDVGKSRLLSDLAAQLVRMRSGAEWTGGSDTGFFVDIETEALERLVHGAIRAAPNAKEPLPLTPDPVIQEIGIAVGYSHARANDGPIWFLTDTEHPPKPPDDASPEILLTRMLWGQETGWARRESPFVAAQLFRTEVSETHCSSAVLLREVLPAPVQLPVDTTEVDQRVTDVVRAYTRIHDALEFAIATLGSDGSESETASWDNYADEVGQPEKPVTWFTRQTGEAATSTHPRVIEGAKLAEIIANGLLPRFVSDRYSIYIECVAPELNGAGACAVRLKHNDPDANDFALSELADGFQLWTQFAVMEAMIELESHTSAILGAIYFAIARNEEVMWEEDNIDFSGDVGEDEYEEEWRSQYVRDERLHIANLLAEARDVPGCNSIDELRLVSSNLPSHPSRPRPSTNPTLYLLDEPERHLHPRLAREAAAWLVHRIGHGQSQAIITTHSVAFLNASPHARYLHAFRDSSGQGVIDEFLPEYQEKLQFLAGDLGFDQGELLTRAQFLLFVEGRADQVVIESLCRRTLFEHGIIVLPIGGAVEAKSIPGSEMLFRFAKVRAGMVFDEVAPEDIEKMIRDQKSREALMRSGSKRDESRRAIANLITNAERFHVPVHPFGYEAPDVFDLLDEDLIATHWPDFPGHAAARKAVAAQPEKKALHWKAFYHDTYGIDMEIEGVFTKVSADMAQKYLIPPEIESIVKTIVELTSSTIENA